LPRKGARADRFQAGTFNRPAPPKLVVQQIGDQPYWSERVAELGIGATHVRMGEVAGQIRTDGAAVAAKLLVSLLSRL
jgi:vancomycin aglycone glucosyltransferase